MNWSAGTQPSIWALSGPDSREPVTWMEWPQNRSPSLNQNSNPPWGSSWMDYSSMRSMNCSWVTSGAPLSSSSSSRASAAQSLARESSSWAA